MSLPRPHAPPPRCLANASAMSIPAGRTVGGVSAKAGGAAATRWIYMHGGGGLYDTRYENLVGLYGASAEEAAAAAVGGLSNGGFGPLSLVRYASQSESGVGGGVWIGLREWRVAKGTWGRVQGVVLMLGRELATPEPLHRPPWLPPAHLPTRPDPAPCFLLPHAPYLLPLSTPLPSILPTPRLPRRGGDGAQPDQLQPLPGLPARCRQPQPAGDVRGAGPDLRGARLRQQAGAEMCGVLAGCEGVCARAGACQGAATGTLLGRACLCCNRIALTTSPTSASTPSCSPLRPPAASSPAAPA